MKKLLVLASISALLAGCAGHNQGGTGTTAYGGSDYGASRTEVDTIPGANQKGAGAADLTENQAAPTGPGSVVTTTLPQNAGGTGAGTTSGSATGTGTGTTTGAAMTDATFVPTAIQQGIAEIGMGQLILQKAQNTDLKNFGQHLAQDHSQANQQLAVIATRKGMTLPTHPDASHQTMINQLANLSGTDFDRRVVNDAVQDHEKDIKFYQQAINTLQDPELKAFAQQTLPMLQRHLEMARQLQATSSGAQGGVGQ